MNQEPLILDSETISEPYVADLHMAGLGARLANRIIDLLVFYVVRYAVLSFWNLQQTWNLFDTANTNSTTINLLIITFSLVFFFFYYFILESLFGKTLGKVLTRTRVVDSCGDRPASNRIAARTISRLIPFEPFSFFGKEPRGWHDSLSKTWVVKDLQGPASQV